MKTQRAFNIHENVELLIEHFPTFLKVFEKQIPFAKYGQFEFHEKTIQRHLSCGSVASAINDDTFLTYLYQTLQAWGIGSRGSRLVPFSEFTHVMRASLQRIAHYECLRIDEDKLNAKFIA